jgi:hypothetical protein
MENNDTPNNGFRFTWKPDDQGQHPYTYNWFNIMADNLVNVNKHQAELEIELSYMDLVDYLVEQMPAYPDVDQIIEQIRANIQ